MWKGNHVWLQCVWPHTLLGFQAIHISQMVQNDSHMKYYGTVAWYLTKVRCTGNITVKHIRVLCLSFTFFAIEAELTRQHSSRMHTTHLLTIHVLVITTRLQFSGGGGVGKSSSEQIWTGLQWLPPEFSRWGGGNRYQVWCEGKRERNTTKCNCSILNAATIPHLLFPILSFTRNSIYFHHVMKHLCIEHAVQTKLAPCDMWYCWIYRIHKRI